MTVLKEVREPADLEACLRIRRRVFMDEQGVPEYLEVDEYDVPGGGCRHYLMLSDGQPIGTFRCLDKGGGVIKLQRFCVLPACRGTGVGRSMLALLEDVCRRRGVARIEMGAQCHAVPFYEKCGYTVVSEQFMDAGIPHVKMAKQLSFL